LWSNGSEEDHQGNTHSCGDQASKFLAVSLPATGDSFILAHQVQYARGCRAWRLSKFLERLALLVSFLCVKLSMTYGLRAHETRLTLGHTLAPAVIY
jgi:hypothetical protein